MEKTTSLKEKAMAKLAGARVKLALLMSTGMVFMVSSVSATEINWTNITMILEGVVNLFPSILTLVINVFPIIIVISIIGFVVSFLDKILDMIKI